MTYLVQKLYATCILLKAACILYGFLLKKMKIYGPDKIILMFIFKLLQFIELTIYLVIQNRLCVFGWP